MDVDALGQQVQEKKAREAAEAEETLRYADLANYFDNQVCHLVQQKRLKEQEIAKSYHNFHVEQQKKNETREWDLNDPAKLKTEVPLRHADAPLGPSSLQVFDGEDAAAGSRRALQMAQQSEWHKAQCEEKRAAQEAEKLEQMELAVTLENQERVMMDVSRDERDLRRAKAIETAKANLALAQEKRDREAREKGRELAANEAEIRSVQGSNMMTENPDVGVNAGQPHRYRTDHWKGMSRTQLDNISHFQGLQVQENQARRQADQYEDAREAHFQSAVVSQLTVNQHNKGVAIRQKNNEVKDYLETQKAEKKARDEQISNLYTNEPTDAYFKQFGTSHR